MDVRALLADCKPPLLLEYKPQRSNSPIWKITTGPYGNGQVWTFHHESGEQYTTTDPQEAQILSQVIFPMGPPSNDTMGKHCG